MSGLAYCIRADEKPLLIQYTGPDTLPLRYFGMLTDKFGIGWMLGVEHAG